MNDLIIREATISDAERMAEIDEKCFTIPWSLESFKYELEENDKAFYLVGEMSGQIVAYAGLWKILNEGHITNVAVVPDFHHRGIATRLFSVFIEESRKKEIDSFTLEVRSSNVAAQKLYSKFGFKKAGVRPRYYEENKEDAIIMWMSE